MKYVVLLKMVPDVVEELEIGNDGRSLDSGFLRMILSEPCEHALEQALLLKEKFGGTVTAAAMDAAELDDALFTGLAKGADRVVKLTGASEGVGSPAQAKILASFLKQEGMAAGGDILVLAGSYAIDDLDGALGPYVARILDVPYVGVVTSVEVDEGAKKVRVMKEFAGGVRGRFEISLPAVLGIQAAESPPRYVPVAKVRAAMKQGKIEEKGASAPAAESAALVVDKMYKPEETGRAEMLEGSPEEVSKRIVELLAEQGLI
ncbi:MAG: electron transfer flavoprotein subunit beta/FixA family protein [bacterium]